MPRPKKTANPYRYFNSSPEVIRLVEMMYVRFRCGMSRICCSKEGSTATLQAGAKAHSQAGGLARTAPGNAAVSTDDPKGCGANSLQMFASVHASFHNHFVSDRHLLDRQTYKLHRSAALAKQQSLAA